MLYGRPYRRDIGRLPYPTFNPLPYQVGAAVRAKREEVAAPPEEGLVRPLPVPLPSE